MLIGLVSPNFSIFGDKNKNVTIKYEELKHSYEVLVFFLFVFKYMPGRATL